MSKDNAPSFVRVLIYLSMAFLLGQISLSTRGDCSTGASVPLKGSSLVQERLSHSLQPDHPLSGSVRCVYTIRPGDCFSTVMEQAGVSKKDALLIAKKAHRVYSLHKMRPGSELEIYFTPDGTGLQEVDFKVNNRRRVVLYNSRVIPLARNMTAAVSRAQKEQSLQGKAPGKIPAPTGRTSRADGATRMHPGPLMKALPTPGQGSQEKSRPAVSLQARDDMRVISKYACGLPDTITGSSQTPYELLADGLVLPPDAPWKASSLRKPGRVHGASALARHQKASPISQKRAMRLALLKKKRQDEEGFLRAPLAYRCVSSGFSYNRVHPITNEEQPHLGIDYAASAGTPVHSIGAGRVVFVGWDGGYGKTIRVKHTNGFVSQYGHLSRYARDLNPGERVRKGEIIGYVGMTGFATGPHLDFRVSHQGDFINPARIHSRTKKISSGKNHKTRG